MRIGIDVKALRGKTGISNYLRSLMEHLQDLDSENEYFLFEPTLSNYKVTNTRWKKVLVSSGLPGTIWQQFILPIYLKKYAVELFWAPEQICPVIRSGCKKIVTTIFDMTAYRFPDTCQYSNLIVQRSLLRKTIRRSNLLLPISDFVSHELTFFFSRVLKPDQVVVVPCGGPDWRLPDDYKEENRKEFLFFAGNLEPRKNLMRLIEALEKLNRTGLKVSLHIAGTEGWKNKKILEKINSSVVKNQIRFLGYLTEEDLKKQYMSCKAVVYPSLYEGFGLPVLEAVSMNAPVITSKSTVMEEVAGEYAIYVDPYDVDDIAAKISCFYNQANKPSIDQHYKEHLISKYSWKKSASRLLNLFKSI